MDKQEPVKMDASCILLLETIKGIAEKSSVAGIAVLVCDEDGTVAMHMHVRADLHQEGVAPYITTSLARSAFSWAQMAFEPLIAGMAKGVQQLRAARRVMELPGVGRNLPPRAN